MENRTLGILGGGQLGRMMVEACHRLGIKVAVLDPGGSSSPAGQISDLVVEGDFNDISKINELAAVSDVLTIEIEHVNTTPLFEMEKAGRIVQPSASTVQMIQDKYNQKVHLRNHEVAVGDFIEINSKEDCYHVGDIYNYPYILKKKKFAYDGNGNYVIKCKEDIDMGYSKLGEKDLYAEKWIPYIKEIAIMVVKSQSGVVSYPVVETIQDHNICHIVIAPAQISELSKNEAIKIASSAIATMTGYGIFGVELFLLPDDSILLNEIAPRPHNSGHYTMETCILDQFEMHVRAVMNLPCPIPRMTVGAAMMINILGKSTMEETKAELLHAMSLSTVGIHWYGKKDNKLRRKMAHYTVIADSMNELIDLVETLHITPEMHGLKKKGPKVGIVMGSDSDLPTMKEAAIILDSFNVPYEIQIVSAHRTPTRMYTYAQSAVERGIQVIIAGAGGAAHLPGMIAALTPLPVIGVPVFTSTLHGQDSLLSIVQMPKGIPVATVAIGNAANAGLLAVRILGGADVNLIEKMEQYMINQEEEVLKKAEKLETIGYQAYLDKK